MSPELFPRKELAPEYDGPRFAAVGSVLFHIGLLLYVVFAPSEAPKRRVPERELAKRVTPLVDPPVQLTQKAPNREKLTKELNLPEIKQASVQPRPAVKPPTPQPAPRKTFTPPPAQMARNTPPPTPAVQSAPEPPKLEAPKEVVKLPAIQAQIQMPPPPPPAPQPEKPKLAFQNATAPPAPTGPVNPKFAAQPSISQAVQNLAHGGGGGGMSVGDSISDSGTSMNLPASPGRQLSHLDLKSDPMGVDFKPYLIRVLATVKRNWLAIYPEAARLGTRGKVTVEFSVGTDGKIQKIVYNSQSGSRPLDEAAVAALSASNPLPALPAEFKGQRIILQFTFAYNISSR